MNLLSKQSFEGPNRVLDGLIFGPGFVVERAEIVIVLAILDDVVSDDQDGVSNSEGRLVRAATSGEAMVLGGEVTIAFA
jgi:hypothetical protein